MDFDYVIVGGGTAGIITAARLAEDVETTVCILEAGPSDEGNARILEYRQWESLLRSEYDYDYGIEPQASGNSLIRHARARMLGGCSSHNSVIALRAFDRDLEEWEALGAKGWGPSSSLPLFQKVTDRVVLTKFPRVNLCAQAFVEAGQALGFPLMEMDGSADQEGVGWLYLNIHGDVRQSSSVAYLHPLDQLPHNLVVHTDVWVNKILLDDSGRAVGVTTADGQVTARREVIVACGPFESPRLLMLSGIGPTDELRRHGIGVQVDLPVGEHLIDHPQGYALWETSRENPLEGAHGFEAALFANVHDTIDWPDIEIVFGTRWAFPDTEEPGFPPKDAEHAMVMLPSVCHARSEGVVRLTSAEPSAPLAIDPRYFTDSDGYDLEVMLAGLELARSLASTAPLRDWVKEELAPAAHGATREQLRRYAARVANTNDHPAGTCRMGASDDPRAVVDPALRVRGVDGLRVADSSVFPSMPSVNICLTTMMIGEKCAALIRS